MAPITTPRSFTKATLRDGNGIAGLIGVQIQLHMCIHAQIGQNTIVILQFKAHVLYGTLPTQTGNPQAFQFVSCAM